jgi:hypothetical protein
VALEWPSQRRQKAVTRVGASATQRLRCTLRRILPCTTHLHGTIVQPAFAFADGSGDPSTDRGRVASQGRQAHVPVASFNTRDDLL